MAFATVMGPPRDRTLVVVTSDHGEMLGDHWLMGKLGYFDGAFAVPLVVRAPGIARRGLAIDEFSESVDIMPTVLDLLGIDAPASCDGLPATFPRWRPLTARLAAGGPLGAGFSARRGEPRPSHG